MFNLFQVYEYDERQVALFNYIEEISTYILPFIVFIFIPAVYFSIKTIYSMLNKEERKTSNFVLYAIPAVTWISFTCMWIKTFFIP